MGVVVALRRPTTARSHLRAGAATALTFWVAGFAAGGLTFPARAAEWVVSPFLEAEQTFTDNVEASETDREADTLTTVTGGVGITGTGARLQFDLRYAVSWDQVWLKDDESGMRHNLLGDAASELIEDFFFVDAGAAVSQRDISTAGPVAVTPRTVGDNQTTVVNAMVSPYVASRLGSFADAELRYRFGNVLFRENELDSASGVPGDTIIHEATVTLADSSWFSRLGWTLTASGTRSDDKDGDTFERRGGEASLSYQIIREIALVGTGGWEDIDADDVDDEQDGPYWTGGLRLTPGPRLLLEVQYGRRFDDAIWSGQLSYRFSPNIMLRAAYADDVGTQQLTFAETLGSIERDADGNLIDPVTGLPADPNDPRFNLTDQVFRERGIDVSLIGSRGRNNFVLSGFYSKREFDISTANETVYGGNGSFTRRLRRDLTGVIDGGYAVTTESIDDERTIRARASLQYQMSESLVANMSYNFLRRERETGGTLREFAVVIGIRKNF